MFQIDSNTGNITMHSGDTGAFKVHAVRETGEAWTSADRMEFTVIDSQKTIRLKRYYRLDTALGNGYALVQFHNDDTDSWPAGTYRLQRRYWVNPSWNGTAPTGDVTDAMADGVSGTIEGDIVRISEIGQGTLTIIESYGEVL